MLTKKERERILRDYPETISKEQFYKLCQISKNRARELLIRGIVPCQITRRATHKYVIATACPASEGNEAARRRCPGRPAASR